MFAKKKKKKGGTSPDSDLIVLEFDVFGMLDDPLEVGTQKDPTITCHKSTRHNNQFSKITNLIVMEISNMPFIC